MLRVAGSEQHLLKRLLRNILLAKFVLDYIMKFKNLYPPFHVSLSESTPV
jgi:hypothetical protein